LGRRGQKKGKVNRKTLEQSSSYEGITHKEKKVFGGDQRVVRGGENHTERKKKKGEAVKKEKKKEKRDRQGVP